VACSQSARERAANLAEVPTRVTEPVEDWSVPRSIAFVSTVASARTAAGNWLGLTRRSATWPDAVDDRTRGATCGTAGVLCASRACASS